MQNLWNTVEEFRDWYTAKGYPMRPPFLNPIFHTDNAMSLCLFREGRFQVELYITKPFATSPPHTHPGVESAFVYLTGDIQFGIENKDTVNKKMHYAREDGAHRMLGATSSSPDGLAHWLDIGADGAAFLSFEYWKDKEPVSVTVNWKGDPVGSIHEEILKQKIF
jgi:hypothetical protein